jgi:hypothetical protein
MQRHFAAVWQHLRGMGCQPTTFAIQWMVTAFAGYLAVEQVCGGGPLRIAACACADGMRDGVRAGAAALGSHHWL